jgi:hypothetical protein
MNPWVIGGGALLLLLVTRGAKAALPVYDEQEPGERDLDALADMLIVETGFNRDKNEMAQIVFVALNRSRKYKKPIYSIVDPSQRKPLWNSSSDYLRLFNNARSNRTRWSAARTFARDVPDTYRNLGYTAFVHPGGQPKPPCSSNRTAMQTGYYGVRCLPTFALKPTPVGGALFA